MEHTKIHVYSLQGGGGGNARAEYRGSHAREGPSAAAANTGQHAEIQRRPPCSAAAGSLAASRALQGGYGHPT